MKDYLFNVDWPLVGQPVPEYGQLPDGDTLKAELWVGTSPDNLTKQVETTFSDTSGILQGKPWTLSGVPAGITAYAQIDVYPTRYASYSVARGATYCTIWGDTGVFTFTPNTAALPIYSPSVSTWAGVTYDLDTPIQPDYIDSRVLFGFPPVPEPSVICLSLLGAVTIRFSAGKSGERSKGPVSGQCPLRKISVD